MTNAGVDIIDKSAEKANLWLKELAAELDGDRREAYRLLRAFLHALRDRITVAEAVQLGQQLPVLIRGIYYDGWEPSRTPETYRDIDTFLERVSAEAKLGGETETSYAVAAAAAVLRRHVSAGEIDDILSILPKELRSTLAG